MSQLSSHQARSRVCASCGRDLSEALDRRVRYCSGDCKRHAHTDSRRAKRSLARVARDANGDGQLGSGLRLVGERDLNELASAAAQLAVLLVGSSADRARYNALPVSQLSPGMAELLALADLSDHLVRLVGSVIGRPEYGRALDVVPI